jgi:hypothetical protein
VCCFSIVDQRIGELKTGREYLDFAKGPWAFERGCSCVLQSCVCGVAFPETEVLAIGFAADDVAVLE